ncbi:DNA-binding transcriptional regulator, LacI/PurR family [Leifsonia sp. 98AMF]|uniref:substrate-binding domain-containing protein n=1 Tax=unclassified Leifsonia TaxID=2663824 RepID=UPI00087A6858|nr:MULTISPECIES: substrate-binding domain-containing protein [unclassified Leifsonia]SDH71828.1 DNA-binding transcriptional regulator, LacI/PurR family [Leifsonia sp. 197AMF]SDJ50170.1 DNA-binding transcriptional regulator, LacI/PurR family [Leifsonia sp. 466MF]SDK24295.1 DNA-binding transcriptional regulator, LacI/PurR family [Leifsonia sp. 157MF]SDN70061.1 DNA-binding transcriptional regulator, LacI/PurR family [Leifsonia sp. 509MF]SEN38169.1 DNA-binding transcriptional regulator, LacI/PurR 
MTRREPLYAIQRRERILDELRARGAVSVSVLAGQLGVSELTVRRDINTLAQQGLVTRVHGGATLRSALDAGPRSSVAPMPAKYTIGMVVPSLDYYWPAVVNGARAQAAQRRASLLLRASTYDARDTRRQIEALLTAPGLHGLIVAPDTTGADAMEVLRWLDTLPVPVVLAERRVSNAAAGRLDSVSSDHAAGAALAVRHLHEAGHTRIGLLTESGTPTGRYVRLGWRSALESLGLPRDVARIDGIRFDVPGRERALDEALEVIRSTGTTAVVVLPDPQAIALEQHAIDRDVRVPHDLAIVAYDDEVARFGDPPLSAVRPPKEFVGREAVDLLIARLEGGPGRPAHRVKLGPELRVRESSLPASIVDVETD